MQNLAKKLDTTEATQLGGYVVKAGPRLVVRVGHSTSATDYEAKRATSCLLDPVLGDHVLLAVFGDGRAFVLAVLERTEEGPATASLDRDLTLRVPNGQINLVAKEGPLLNERDGVLVLSENAGAADELAPWALLVSPFDIGEQADALHWALTLPEDERAARLAGLREHIRGHDIGWWADGLFAALDALPLARRG